jgi:DNA gyrase/topoisomerase IV subunit B
MAKDVQMFYIESDIKKIQTKTNLYIQKYGPAGAFHLAREIIQNNIDECIDPESNGSNIYISYDKESDMLTCEDDGRGFPEKDYPLDIFCTKNQSGSKFFRDQGGDSAGELTLSSCTIAI